ncbi:hypothetical protein Tsubulata_038988 [Turnera subulata]|uniref:PB1-like domain-containing protein n=1 Tax=Turnera subulata TaxID=218843 RepID=A0A9Q0G1P0_9ROSI|nr:hypothetical protein Tsubulata_038988 [Turnera subulata]
MDGEESPRVDDDRAKLSFYIGGEFVRNPKLRYSIDTPREWKAGVDKIFYHVIIIICGNLGFNNVSQIFYHVPNKTKRKGRARGYLLDEELVAVNSDRDLGPLFDLLCKYNTTTFYIEHGKEDHPYWGVDNPVNVVRRHNIPLPPNYVADEEEQLQPQIQPATDGFNDLELPPSTEDVNRVNEFGGGEEGQINGRSKVAEGQNSIPDTEILFEGNVGKEQVNDHGHDPTEVLAKENPPNHAEGVVNDKENEGHMRPEYRAKARESVVRNIRARRRRRSTQAAAEDGAEADDEGGVADDVVPRGEGEEDVEDDEADHMQVNNDDDIHEECVEDEEKDELTARKGKWVEEDY